MSNNQSKIPIPDFPLYTIDKNTFEVSINGTPVEPDDADMIKVYLQVGKETFSEKYPRAKLAWCALNNVSPIDVGDNYAFYFIDGKPAKVKTSDVSKTITKKDAKFWKDVMSWAEKQGYYNPQTFIETIHHFLNKYNVNIKNCDDYVIVSKKTALKYNDDTIPPGKMNVSQQSTSPNKVNNAMADVQDGTTQAQENDPSSSKPFKTVGIAVKYEVECCQSEKPENDTQKTTIVVVLSRDDNNKTFLDQMEDILNENTKLPTDTMINILKDAKQRILAEFPLD